MYTPVSQNDLDKLQKLLDQGATIEEAWNLIDDDYQSMEGDTDGEVL